MVYIGMALVLAGILIGVYFLWEDNRGGKEAQAVAFQLEEQIEDTGENDIDPDRTMPTITIHGNRYIGVLEIPALGVKLPVMESWSYDKLKIAPCRYNGTVYAGNMVICAHNYRSHFGNLKTLKSGAEVRFTDTEGTVFQYEVASIEVLRPEQEEEMTTGDWGLTLFTCTPGGKTRVTVRCNTVY